MSDFTELVGRYLAIWNEPDASVRRAAIAGVWTESGSYTDPLAAVDGHDAIDALIGAARAQFPGLVFESNGPVDAHHNTARFGWRLVPAGGGDSIVEGFDVAVLAEDGRISGVYGFLDKVPAGVTGDQ
ncbi:nuclear transport factor 2 family protein [Rugosimonospora africana]|uniref:Isomerase n=1 Tax=Rugosimonospora africana TaxID=556532 RepID=A0A8J3QNW1_9ACTN|nr:nuclear transport factor 2 family protein [Rugosimonospora africana]GIH12833.1 isomerase [Rugosimonospora africana]